ncbi:hypothetical protein D3C86_2098480 [compost metagenome]
MDPQRRQQAHHAPRHAKSHFGQRPVLAERASRQAVDAAGDPFKLASRDQPAEDHCRQAMLSQIPCAQQRPTLDEREDSLFEC